MLKKLTALFCTAMTVLLGSAGVFAADTAALGISSARAAAGKDFSVYVSLTDVPSGGVSAMDFAVSCDKNVVTVKSVEPCGQTRIKSDSASKEMFACNINKSAGRANVCWATYGGSDYAVKSAGQVFKITGTLSASAAAGTSSKITLVPISRKAYVGASDSNSAVNISGGAGAYTASVSAGTISVSAGGDVNNDGYIDKADAGLVLKYILSGSFPSGSNAAAADVAAEFGKIDVNDAIWILNNMTAEGDALDLSKVSEGTYANNELSINDTLSFQLELPKTVSWGDELKVYIKARDNGGTGFRAYLTAGQDEALSEIYSAKDLSSESQDIEFTLTPKSKNDKATHLLIKGPDWQTKIGDVVFEYIGVDYPDEEIITSTDSGASHSFDDGTADPYFTVSGNLSTKYGTVTYSGETIEQCLKMETATSITFDAESSGTLTMVFAKPSNTTTTVYVDGTAKTIPSDGILTVSVGAGSHEIKKGSGSSYLFYISVS
ncbi:MAG: hypothetical protein IJR45_07990 [Firmicutes bacterium]|nr:hypothetical protein [Bacillota bacterium]MBQ9605338.1 hypothetical protein [Bacillota bacterium]